MKWLQKHNTEDTKDGRICVDVGIDKHGIQRFWACPTNEAGDAQRMWQEPFAKREDRPTALQNIQTACNFYEKHNHWSDDLQT